MTISMPVILMLTTDVTDVKIMSELMFYLFLVPLEPNVSTEYANARGVIFRQPAIAIAAGEPEHAMAVARAIESVAG